MNRSSAKSSRLSMKWGIRIVILVAVWVQIYSLRTLFLAQDHQQQQQQRCAINLFGLPRAFESLVLPSLIKNVIRPNAKYNCDYFVHYYQLEQEPPGRSGQGGLIHPEQVLLLRRAVFENQNNDSAAPTVSFTADKEDDFWKRYQSLLDKIRTTKDTQGRTLYFPYKARTYTNPTTTNNIIKMWHSIQSVWNLMQQHEQQHIKYTQVAMLRSDVVYMTPIDLYEYGPNHVVVPAFGRHPVSDRIVYGPRDAVEIWAAERFDRMEQHVQFVLNNDPGWGLHSERFVNYALFPAMRQKVLASSMANKEPIIPHPTLCFFRARADETVWVSDCDGPPDVSEPSITKNLLHGHINVKTAVERVLGRSCPGKVIKLNQNVKTLDCAKSVKG